jgi:signal transduction histidine kinase
VRIIFVLLIGIFLYSDEVYNLSNLSTKELLTKYQKFYIQDRPINAIYELDRTKLSHHKTANFGRIGKSAISLLTIQNDTNKKQSFILQHPRAGTDYISVWLIYNNGIVKYHKLGDLLNISDRELQAIRSSVELTLDINQTVEIIACFTSTGFLEANWNIIPKYQFYNELKYHTIFWGLFCGMMLSLAIYNLISYISNKNKTYIIHSLYAFSIMIAYISIYGFLYYIDILPNQIVNMFSYNFVTFLLIFHTLLPIYFFDMKKSYKKVYYVLIFMVYIMIIATFILTIGLFNNNIYLFTKYIISIILIDVFLVFLVSVYFYRERYIASGYYFVSQTFVIISYIYNTIAINKPIEKILFLDASSVISFLSLLEIIFINIAMAIKMRTIVDERNMLRNVANLYENYIYIGKYASDINHQWKVPLSNLSSILAMLRGMFEIKKSIPNNIIEESLEDLDRVCDSFKKISDDVYDYMSNSTTKREINIQELIYETIGYLGKNSSGIKFIYIHTNQNITTIKSALRQVLLHILSNAINNFDNKKIENREIKFEFFINNNIYKLIISDNGGGMNKNIMNKLFIPYNSLNSLGTGLFVAKQLAKEKLNGNLKLIPIENGTKVEVDIAT